MKHSHISFPYICMYIFIYLGEIALDSAKLDTILSLKHGLMLDFVVFRLSGVF